MTLPKRTRVAGARYLDLQLNDKAKGRLGEELGLGKAAPLDTPKNALRRLQKEELVVVKLEYGHYHIQDEGFVEWLRQLELEE
jgi:hypothetical protein